LASVLRHTNVPYELIISDASDSPMAPTPSRYMGPAGVVVLQEKPRLGFVKGYNQAFRRTTGKWVLWLNDDAEVLPGYASAAVRFMEQHPEIGLGALFYSHNGDAFHVNSHMGVPYANFGILSRELGEQLGWLDTDFTMYGSDNALTYRVLMSGSGIAGIPDARLLHHAENDKARMENEYLRRRDGGTLRRKYGALEKDLQRAYAKTAHLTPSLILDEVPA
jgi:GT2 family glycosyltransferase